MNHIKQGKQHPNHVCFSLIRQFLFLWLALAAVVSHVFAGPFAAAAAASDYDKIQLLASPIQYQLEWALDVALPLPTSISEAEYEERFAAVFRQQLSLEVFQQAIATSVGGNGINQTWTLERVSLSTPAVAAVVLGYSSKSDSTAMEEAMEKEELIVLTIAVVDDDDDDVTQDAEEIGKITGFLLQPFELPSLEDAPQNTQEAITRLEEFVNQVGYEYGFVVAQVNETSNNSNDDEFQCTPLLGKGSEEPMPLGSMFKFYVLAAVVQSIADDGGLLASWSTPIEIQEEYFSLTSGMVQGDAPGSTRSVRQLAELMIAISDNTATDHLLYTVGRTAVEQAMMDSGHHNPTLNMPFLSTKEFFLLKLLSKDTNDTLPGPTGAAFINASSIEERRRILEEDLANVSISSLDVETELLWTQPVAIDAIEWWASPMDLCRVLTILQQNDVAREILAINPGSTSKELENLWSYIGFKGGSEPGVLGLAWYVEGWDGTHKVVAGSFWNQQRALTGNETTTAVLLLESVRDSFSNVEKPPPPSQPSTDSNGEATEEDATMMTGDTSSAKGTHSKGVWLCFLLSFFYL